MSQLAMALRDVKKFAPHTTNNIKWKWDQILFDPHIKLTKTGLFAFKTCE